MLSLQNLLNKLNRTLMLMRLNGFVLGGFVNGSVYYINNNYTLQLKSYRDMFNTNEHLSY